MPRRRGITADGKSEHLLQLTPELIDQLQVDNGPCVLNRQQRQPRALPLSAWRG